MKAKPNLPPRYDVRCHIEGIGEVHHIIRAVSHDAVSEKLKRAYPGKAVRVLACKPVGGG